jgi:MFS family permease
VIIKRPSMLQAVKELWLYRGILLPLLAVLAVAEIALGGVVIWAAPALGRVFGIPLAHIDAAMAVGLLISGIAGPIAGGAVADLCQKTGGPRRTMRVLGGLGALCVPTSLFAMMPGFASATACLVAFITILTAIVVMQTTLFTIVVPNELRGLCMGVVVATSVLVGTGIAPPVVSLISDGLGGSGSIGLALTFVCVSMTAMGALLCFLTAGSYPRQTVKVS